MNCLIVSNMGPHKAKPALGSFVINQYKELSKQNKYDFDLFLMPEHAYRYNLSLIRYLIFFFCFLMFCIKSKKKFDLIHVHFFFPTIIFVYIYKLIFNRKVKFVATFHGTDVYSYSYEAKIYKFFLKRLYSRIYVSKSLKIRHSSVPGRSVVLPAGILDCFTPLENIPKKYDFIFVGNLEFVKGADRLIELICEAKDMKFMVIGNGAYASKIEELEGSNFVYKKSATPAELNKLFNESRCLINLSRNESFGLVMSEAMSCGLPVIATKTDGAIEQLIDTSYGIVIDQNFNKKVVLDAFSILSADEVSGVVSERILYSKQFKLSSVVNEVVKEYDYAFEER